MNGFAIIESKDSFLIKLANGEISSESIVFIKDSQEIWTHGTFFGAASGINNHVVVTQEQYNSLLENNLLDDNMFYYISE